MIVFGLTGGIGSGKSSAAAIMREVLPVVDADALAREAVEPGGPGLSQIVGAFGVEAIGKDGRMDRKRMGRLAFSDSSVRARLNAIVHPLVRDLAAREWARLEAEGVRVAGYDVPLLFESMSPTSYRPTVVVYAPEEVQVARVMARDNLREDEARSRVLAQMPLAEKARLADVVIDNGGTLEELRHRVSGALPRILELCEQSTIVGA
jgi:dephospho-CoA kinase